MFTHSAFWWRRRHEVAETKTRDYHQRLNVWVSSQISKQFRTSDLRKWGTFKVVYLSFYWFNDLWIWTCNLWIRTCTSWIWIRTFEFKLVLLSLQLLTRNSQLVTCNLCFTISHYWSTCLFTSLHINHVLHINLESFSHLSRN